MRLSAEATLMLLAAALYLFDCFYLLRSNEALLIRGQKRWTARFGSRNWMLAGGEPCMVNVLAPHRPTYKLAWQFEAEGAVREANELVPNAVVSRFAPFAYMGLALIFVGLPLALFANLGLVFTLSVVLGIYANNLLALSILFVTCDRVGLTKARYWSLAFECFVCPPFCIQLAKRLYALQPVPADFVQVATSLLLPEDAVDVHRQCLVRLDDQIAYEDEGSVRALALHQSRKRFSGGGLA
jgi:hypothetical protein